MQFRSRIDCPLITVELSFDGDFISEGIRIPGDLKRNAMWQKERLLNIGLRSLPDDVNAVAFIDADLMFQNPGWLAEAAERLEEFPVVQLYDTIEDTGPTGEIIRLKYGSVGKVGDGPLCPGGALAMRRELLADGLYDANIVGGGDTRMMMAWTGDWTCRKWSSARRQHWMRWAVPQFQAVRGRLGYVRGTLRHLYHGEREHRQYGSRENVLQGFNPFVDIRLDSNGLWEWSAEKQAMRQAMLEYFRLRQDDGICARPSIHVPAV